MCMCVCVCVCVCVCMHACVCFPFVFNSCNFTTSKLTGGHLFGRCGVCYLIWVLHGIGSVEWFVLTVLTDL